jgi:hypothetical protein
MLLLQVLANRPGFPFLGNDFFKECGDVFSVHVVDNPDLDSEISLLRFYAPDVGVDVIRKLCCIFHDLRRAFDDGSILYPYSARELVNIVKHLQAFPADGVVEAVQNVIAFDSFNESSSAKLIEVFSSHGVPVGVMRPTAQSVKLASKVNIGPPKSLGTLSLSRTCSSRRHFCSANAPLVPSDTFNLNRPNIFPNWVQQQVSVYTSSVISNVPSGITSSRLSFFSELVSQFTASSNHGHIRRIIRSTDGAIHALMDPPALHTYNPPDYSSFSRIDLSILSYFFKNRFQAEKCFFFSSPTGDVIIVIQDANVLVKLHPPSGRLSYMKTPSIEVESTQSSSTIRKVMSSLVAKPSIAEDNRLHLVLECGVCIFSCSSALTLSCVDLVSDYSCSLDLRDIIAVVNPRDSTAAEDYAVSVLAKIAADKFLLRCHSKSSTLSIYVEISRLESGNIPVISACSASVSFPLSFFSFDRLNETSFFGAGSGFAGAYLDVARLNHDDVQLMGLLPESSSHDARVSCANPRMKCVISSFVPPSAVCKQSHHDDWLRITNVESGDVFLVQSPRSLYESERTPSERNFPDAPNAVIDLQASHDGVVSLHSDGVVRIWQLEQDALALALGQWKTVWGDVSNKQNQLRLNKDASDRKKVASSPKHGKHDPKNERHSGGNTWAGGTGGSDTAGLGGKGGPYRLDTGGGHDIDQLSDEEKADLSQDVKDRAREMAKEAFAKRLAEIGMGERDASIYSEIYERVRHEINLMREILNSVQTRQNEREWIRFQSAGDFDDGRIVDGAAGGVALRLFVFHVINFDFR